VAFFDAIFPARIAALDQVAEAALAEPDPWRGFTGFLEGLFELQSRDHGLNDALARRFPETSEVEEACHSGFRHASRIIGRAQESGQLRADETELAEVTRRR
jgi:hypothetical protein